LVTVEKSHNKIALNELHIDDIQMVFYDNDGCTLFKRRVLLGNGAQFGEQTLANSVCVAKLSFVNTKPFLSTTLSSTFPQGQQRQ
jgi:hypothetical protein